MWRPWLGANSWFRRFSYVLLEFLRWHGAFTSIVYVKYVHCMSWIAAYSEVRIRILNLELEFWTWNSNSELRVRSLSLELGFWASNSNSEVKNRMLSLEDSNSDARIQIMRMRIQSEVRIRILNSELEFEFSEFAS